MNPLLNARTQYHAGIMQGLRALLHWSTSACLPFKRWRYPEESFRLPL